jgi:hypothetical protein
MPMERDRLVKNLVNLIVVNHAEKTWIDVDTNLLAVLPNL